MKAKLEIIKDRLNNDYLGIKIEKSLIELYLKQLSSNLSEEDYCLFIFNQNQRDNGCYHITVINVFEWKKIIQNISIETINEILENYFNFDIKGIGTANKGINTTYFCVVESEDLIKLREKFYLSPHDFHITIGFNPKDVFGVRKNQVIIENFSMFLETHFLKK